MRKSRTRHGRTAIALVIGLSACATPPERPMPPELYALLLDAATARVVADFCPTLKWSPSALENELRPLVLELTSQGYTTDELSWYAKNLPKNAASSQLLKRLQDGGVDVSSDTPAYAVPKDQMCAYGEREKRKSSTIGKILL